MRCFELIKDTLGMKKGQTFIQTPDGMYANATSTVRLNSVMIENNEEYFKETEAPDMWRPTQPGEAFWTVTPDGGVIELPWDELKFARLWQYGNVFREKEHADEVSQAIAVMIPTYQKRFNEYIKKTPKEPKLLTQSQNFQQPTPPVVQPQGMPPVAPPPGQPMAQPPPPPPMMQPNPRYSVHDPRYSPGGVGNLFTQPGYER